MALWVIEIGDAELTVWRDGEAVERSPGVALVDNREILTGDAALARRYLQPRAVFDRFWQHLNDAPLNRPDLGRRIRHHADLAYCHLKDVLGRCGQPREAVLVVPPHYDAASCAWLLGIAKALDLEIAALVDAAVATLAACAPRGRYQLAELYTHHASLTTVEVGDRVRRTTVDVIETAGLSRIHSACADLVADAFLEQARFDPLHEAASEQRLHAALPEWLERSAERHDLELVLHDDRNRFNARVGWREFERVTAMVLAPLADRAHTDDALVVRGTLGQLPGATASLGPFALLADGLSAAAVAEHRLALAPADRGTAWYTELPAASNPYLALPVTTTAPELPPTGPQTAQVTHILDAGTARAIGEDGLGFAADGALGPVSDGCVGSIERRDGSVRLEPAGDDFRLNGHAVAAPCVLHPGDEIRCGTDGRRYLAINVG